MRISTKVSQFSQRSRRWRDLCLFAETAILMCIGSLGQAKNDPVADYLSKFSPVGGDLAFYSSDRLLQLELDLNNDGRTEVLLSLARDRNGKQGNAWVVYRKVGKNYIRVGGMTFSDSRFFLGRIDEIKRFGLVNFWPSGAGEGTLHAYLLEGEKIREVGIANVAWDPKTGLLKNRAALKKYLGVKATLGEGLVTSLPADELAAKYGIKIDPRKYEDALHEWTRARDLKRG